VRRDHARIEAAGEPPQQIGAAENRRHRRDGHIDVEAAPIQAHHDLTAGRARLLDDRSEEQQDVGGRSNPDRGEQHVGRAKRQKQQ